MKEVVVLGIGNRLMMDDGIGIQVVETLMKRNTNSSLRYVVGETDINYCLQQIIDASYIIIVDAAYLGNKPGTVSVAPMQQVLGDLRESISAHGYNFLNGIKLIGKKIEGILIGIEPYELDYSISLSPVLQKQFSEIVDVIENIIDNTFYRG
jgi:hydrogenase maturation protease